MAKYDVIDLNRKKVGEFDLSEDVFKTEVKMSLIHEAVKVALANKRVGSASTKTRGEVKSSNIKPYRQKGTGRARHGSWVSPLFVGGGITFGPKPRDYTIKMTKKKRLAALKAALSSKVQENKLLIIDKWVEKKKTKEMAEVLNKMNIKDAIIVLDGPTPWLERTVRNIPNINYSYTDNLSTLNIIAHDYLVCSKDVVAKLQEGLVK